MKQELFLIYDILQKSSELDYFIEYRNRMKCIVVRAFKYTDNCGGCDSDCICISLESTENVKYRFWNDLKKYSETGDFNHFKKSL